MYELPKTSRAIFKDAKGFERSKQILAALGNPQNSHKTVHVAGTSGKGSVCYLIDAMLRAHGKKTGLMLSPHVYDIRERIQINGQLVSEKKFYQFANLLLEELQPFYLSYFEALTSLGFFITAKEPLDYMVVETGFGGLWDTTNTVSRDDKLSVISQIGFDHTAILGNTIEAIAAQKAGIIREHGSVIVGDQSAQALQVVKDCAAKQRADLTVAKRYDDYQQTNDSLAKAAVMSLAARDGWEFDEQLAQEALSRIFIPGRFEKRVKNDHLTILDGAHNPQKLGALVHRLQFENIRPVTVLFAVGQRKDWRRCLEQLQPVARRIIATEFFTTQSDVPHHAVPAHEIANACEQLGIEAIVKPDPQSALNQALLFPEPIVATGSFYLLGDIDAAM